MYEAAAAAATDHVRRAKQNRQQCSRSQGQGGEAADAALRMDSSAPRSHVHVEEKGRLSREQQITCLNETRMYYSPKNTNNTRERGMYFLTSGRHPSVLLLTKSVCVELRRLGTQGMISCGGFPTVAPVLSLHPRGPHQPTYPRAHSTTPQTAHTPQTSQLFFAQKTA